MGDEDRKRLARIRTPHDDEVGLLDFVVATGTSACSEHCRQTGDGRSVSSAVAAIDVVGVHYDSGEFLSHVVGLIGRFGTAEQPEGVAAVAAEAFCCCSDRFVETCRSENSVLPHQWPVESWIASLFHVHLPARGMEMERTHRKGRGDETSHLEVVGVIGVATHQSEDGYCQESHQSADDIPG